MLSYRDDANRIRRAPGMIGSIGHVSPNCLISHRYLVQLGKVLLVFGRTDGLELAGYEVGDPLADIHGIVCDALEVA